jgi:hypothetical protein
VYAQNNDSAKNWFGKIEGGDTIIERQLEEVLVFPSRNFKYKRQERRFWRYAYKVRKVYPYAKLANELLIKYEPEYLILETQREKRKLMKQLEKELLDEYKEELKKLTISEGRILIKLIDRETKRSSYTLIKDFKGGFSAFFWQSLARLFGNDLKTEFDPAGKDRLIEEIVSMIEMGQFK